MDNIHQVGPDYERDRLDLGWLIQNHQLNDVDFCDFLLSETSVEIERLVRRFVTSPADRIGLVDEVLLTVLTKRQGFKNNYTGKAWLYQIILTTCLDRVEPGLLHLDKCLARILRTIDLSLKQDSHFAAFIQSLTEIERLFAILYYGQDLPAVDIAFVLEVDPQTVQKALSHIQQNLTQHQQTCDACLALPMTMASMEVALRGDLQNDSALIQTAREDLAEWARSLLDRYHRASTHLNTRTWVTRIAEGVLIIFLFFGGEWIINRPPPAETAAIPTDSLHILPTPLVVTTLQPPATPTPSQPITSTANPDWQTIVTFSLTSWARWQSLWADVSIHTYTQEQFSDGTGLIPKESMRKQIWLSLPGASRVIIGPDGANPTLSYSITNDHMSGQNFENSQVIDQQETDIIPDPDLQALFSPTAMFRPDGQFKSVGEDTIAGRPAWIVDWVSNGQKVYRYWIDQQYGVILRRRQYGEGIFQPIISEITVTRIFFNASLPEAVFQPNIYKGDHFSYDFSGNPEIADIKHGLNAWAPTMISLPPLVQTPTPIADFASAQLDFHEEPAGWLQKPQGAGIEVFANHQDLGQLPLGGSSILSCVRSPDGSKIAYNSPPQTGSNDTGLYIADLASIQSAKPALEGGITTGDFAFSPDNRLLAFFGCEKSTGFCGPFILDLSNWKLTRLAPLTYAEYLTWSADGQSIAMLGRGDLSQALPKLSTANLLESEMIPLLHAWSYFVMDPNNGNVTFQQMFDWTSLGQMFTQTSKPGVIPLKTSSLGIQGCLAPPANTGGK